MYHEIESLQRFVTKLAVKQANGGALSDLEAMYLRDMPQVIDRKRADPPVDPWQVVEIRWVPESPIPLKSLVGRYGTDYKDAVNEKFERTLEWEARGVEAYMQDDRATVLSFTFTAGDMFCAEKRQTGKACDPVSFIKKPAPMRAPPKK